MNINKLLDSAVLEDVVIGLEMAYKRGPEEEFLEYLDNHIFNLGDDDFPGYLFEAYGKVNTIFGSIILTGIWTKQTAISRGYKINIFEK